MKRLLQFALLLVIIPAAAHILSGKQQVQGRRYPLGSRTWNNLGTEVCPFVYKATDLRSCGHDWKPSIHMPKEACRIFLRINCIRVERLQDISESDAIKEGVRMRISAVPPYEERYQIPEWPNLFHSAIKAFKSLWLVN